MFGRRPKVEVRVFEMTEDAHRTELAYIKQQVMAKVPGWSILNQREFTNKYGEVFVYLEWTEQ